MLILRLFIALLYISITIADDHIPREVKVEPPQQQQFQQPPPSQQHQQPPVVQSSPPQQQQFQQPPPPQQQYQQPPPPQQPPLPPPPQQQQFQQPPPPPPQQQQYQQPPPPPPQQQQYQQPPPPPPQQQQYQQPPPPPPQQQQYQQPPPPPPQQQQYQQPPPPPPQQQQFQQPPIAQQPPVAQQPPSPQAPMPPQTEDVKKQIRIHLQQMRQKLEQEAGHKERVFENEEDYEPPHGGIDKVLTGMPETGHAHPPVRKQKKDKQLVDEGTDLESVFTKPSINEAGEIIPSDAFAKGQESVSITVLLRPGVKDCFFYTPIADFEVGYLVIQGGKFDVGIFIKNPNGNLIAARAPLDEVHLNIRVPPDMRHRPYAICLDNRKASYSEKRVNLMIDLSIDWENPTSSDLEAISLLRKQDGSQNAAETDENIKEVMNWLDMIFSHFRMVEHMQRSQINMAHKDQSLMQESLSLVTGRSLFQVFIMLSVSILQVVVIRSLFDQTSLLYKFWTGGGIRRAAAPKTNARC